MRYSRPISGVLNHTREFSGFAISQTSYAAGAELLLHCHTKPILSFSITGGTMVSVAGKRKWCEEGSLHYLPTGVPHANSYPGAAVRLHIEVAPSFWKSVAEKSAVVTSRVIRQPVTRELRRSVLSPSAECGPIAEIDIATHLADIIGLIASAKKRKPDSLPAIWLLRLRDFLEAHCTEQLDMQALVRVAGRHPVHISREFRRHFGKTITDFVRTRRVLRVAQLIVQDSQSLASIALECGYFDQSHMTKEFRRHTGETPSRWRGRSNAFARRSPNYSHSFFP